MANVFTSIAISPSGTTLLNALQVTTSAGTVLNEAITEVDASNPNNVGSVLASGARLVEPGGVNIQPVSGTVSVASLVTGPAIQTVTGTVAVIQATATNISITAVQPTAANFNATVVGTVTATTPATQTVAVAAWLAPLGQTSMAASIPVVIPSNQATFPVTVTFPATQTVAGTVTIGAPLGQTSMAASIPVVLASNQSAGAFPATQTVAGTVVISAFPATQTVAGAVTLPSNGSFAATAPTQGDYAGLRGTTALPTAVSDGQFVGMMADKEGRAAVVLNTVRDLVGIYSNTAFTATGALGILTAAASSFWDITSLIITSPQTVASALTLGDGVNSYLFNIAPNGGIAENFVTPLPMGAAAATWSANLSGAGTVSASLVYVKNK